MEGAGDLTKEIVYSVDNFGIMYGFTPINEWPGPEIPPEGIEEDDLPLI